MFTSSASTSPRPPASLCQQSSSVPVPTMSHQPPFQGPAFPLWNLFSTTWRDLLKCLRSVSALPPHLQWFPIALGIKNNTFAPACEVRPTF